MAKRKRSDEQPMPPVYKPPPPSEQIHRAAQYAAETAMQCDPATKRKKNKITAAVESAIKTHLRSGGSRG